MSGYDAWKSTDPADMDPYRDNDCPSCRAPEGYRCTPECDCAECVKAAEQDEREEWLACPREKGDDDGREYADPRDYRAGRE